MKKLMFLSALSFSCFALAKPFKLVLEYPESIVKAGGDPAKLIKSSVYLKVRKTGDKDTGTGTIALYDIESPAKGTPERALLDNYFEMNDPVRPHRKDVFGLTMSMMWQNCTAQSDEAAMHLSFEPVRAVATLAQRKSKGEPIDDPGLVVSFITGCNQKLDACATAYETFRSQATDEEKASAWANLIDDPNEGALRERCCLNTKMDWYQDQWKVSKRGRLDVAAFYDKLQECDTTLWRMNKEPKRSKDKTPTEVPAKHTASADK